MLGWEPLAAMLIRSTNPISKRPEGGLKAGKVLCPKPDNKSIIQSERDKACFKSEGTKLECL
jgi:hypothetical protein